MGMDICGRDPISTTGEYFRRNFSGWRLIPAYIGAQHPDFIQLVVPPVDPETGQLSDASEDFDVAMFWGSNDGYGLPADPAAALADLLDADVASGVAAAWIQDNGGAPFEFSRPSCPICDGETNGFVDGPDGDPRIGQIGPCEDCRVRNTLMSILESYELQPEDLTEFAAFMRASGGFEIW